MHDMVTHKVSPVAHGQVRLGVHGSAVIPGDHLEGYFERIGDSATVLISRIQHPADFAFAVDSIQPPHELVVRQGQVSSVKGQGSSGHQGSQSSRIEYTLLFMCLCVCFFWS